MQILKVAVWFALGIALTAFGQEKGNMNNKDHQTICLGRFLVDMPKDAYQTGKQFNYVDEFEVSTATKEQVRQAILTRESEINAPNNREFLVKKVPGAKPDSTILVRRPKKYKRWGIELGYDLEGYFWMGGRQYLIKSGADSDKLDRALDDMLKEIAQASPRLDHEIPTIPGFCMEGAFFPGAPTEKRHYERVFARFGFRNHPDVWVNVIFGTNGDKLEEGLLARIDKDPIPDIYKPLIPRIKTLRRGQHPVGDFSAEEVLESVPSGEYTQSHVFTWSASGKPRDIYAPAAFVQLKSGDTPGGGKTNPSVTDQQAMELFDSIVNSIRLRPVGPQ